MSEAGPSMEKVVFFDETGEVPQETRRAFAQDAARVLSLLKTAYENGTYQDPVGGTCYEAITDYFDTLIDILRRSEIPITDKQVLSYIQNPSLTTILEMSVLERIAYYTLLKNAGFSEEDCYEGEKVHETGLISAEERADMAAVFRPVV